MNATASRFNENRRRANRKITGGFAARRSKLVHQRPTLESLEERTLLSFTPIPQPTAAYVNTTTNMSASIPGNGTSINNLADGTQTVHFSHAVIAQTVPIGWSTWNSPPATESATPRVLTDIGATTLTLTLAEPAIIFGFEAEGQVFNTQTITATFMDGAATVGTISQSVNGDAGALLFAAETNQVFTSVVLTAPAAAAGFAIAQVSYDLAASTLTGSTGNTITGVEGNPTTTSLLGTFVDANQAATAADFTTLPGSVVVNWGDGSVPQTLAAANLTAIGTPNGVVWTINATHPYAEEGTYAYTVTVTGFDGAAAIVSGSAVIADAPLTSVAVVPPTTIAEGFVVLASAQLFDFDDGNPLAKPADFTTTIDWGDGTPLSTGVVGQFGPGSFYVTSGGHIYDEAGSYQIKITVKDIGGSQLQSPPSGTITVTDAPLLASPIVTPPFNAAEGQLLTNIPIGTFIDGNRFATMADYTGMINWGDGSPKSPAVFTRVGTVATGSLWLVTGSHTYTEASGSPFPVTVAVSDVDGSVLAGGISNTATVTQSPLSVVVVSTNGTAGTAIPFVQAILTDTGGEDPLADYSATILWGDGSSDTVPGTSFIPGVASGTLNIFFPAHTYATPGLYPLTVGVSDSDPAFGLGNGFALIAPASIVPTPAVVIGPFAATEGIALPANTTVGSFDVADPLAVASDYTANIDWGDGSPNSVGTVQPGVTVGGTTTFAVTGNHTYAEKGSYTITVQFSDNYGTTVSSTATANVADAPLIASPIVTPPFNADEGQLLTNIPIGTFIDENPDATAADYTGRINWGDGSPLSTATFTRVGTVPAGSLWLVTGSHTYAFDSGSPFSVTVAISDNDGSVLAGGISNTATVIQTPLVVQATSINGTAGTPTIPGGFAIAEFSDNAGADPIGDYSATIQWGDGTFDDLGTGVTIVNGPNSNSFLVIAPPAGHTYAQPGLYPITVIVHDADAVDGTANSFALIAPAAITVPAEVVIGPFAATEGIALPPNTTVGIFNVADPLAVASEFTAIIDWGDGSPSSIGTIQPGVTVDGTTTFDVTGNHTYVEAGTYTITVQFRDAFGTTVTSTAIANVADAALFDPTAVNVVGTEDEFLNNVPVAMFVDDNPLATPADIISSIDWGDGTASGPGVVTKIGSTATGASLFEVTGSHVYMSSVGSPFTLTVDIADEDTYAINGGVPQLVINPTATISAGSIEVDALPIVVTQGVPTGTGVPGVPTASNELLATFIDASGADPLANYNATVDWGDLTGPDTTPNIPGTGTLTILALGGDQFGVYGTHTYAQPGIYRLTVTVNDTDPATGIGANIAYVLPATIVTITPSPAPGEVPGVLTPGIEGNPLAANTPPPAGATGVELATFVVNSTTAPIADYSAQIDWGDGSPQSAGQITFDPTATAADPNGYEHFVVTGQHTYIEARTDPYVITVTITQSAPGSFFVDSYQQVHVTDSVTINDAPLTPGLSPPIFATEDVPITNVLVGTFTDANPFATSADFSATINWGDGSLPVADPATEVRLIGGTAAGAVFGVYGSHRYTEAGTFSTEVTVVDEDSPGSSISVPPVAALNVTVADSPIQVTGLSVGPFTIEAPTPAGLAVATFIDAASTDPLSNYMATIDWGDGSPTDNGTIVALGGGQFQVDAPTHTYHSIGLFAIKVTVTDADPATGIGSAFAYVKDSVITAMPAGEGPIFGAVEGLPLTATVAAFADTDTLRMPSDYRAVIDWGDGSPQSVGMIVVDPSFGPGTGHFLVMGTHTYADELTTGFTISTTITDNFGAQANTTTTVNAVADATLTAGARTPIFATEQQPLNDVSVGTFIDANPAATAADFSVGIHWGDASPISHGTVQLVGGTAAGAVFAVYGSHVYNDAGTFTTSFSVADEGGSTLINATGGVATISESPISVNVLPETVGVGQMLPSQVIATFLDAGSSDPVTNYTPIIIDWGDGTSVTLTGGTGVAALGGGVYSITAPAHTYTAAGVYTLTVTVNDTDPATGIGAALVIVTPAVLTITPAPGPIAATEGLPLSSVPLARFTDSNPGATAADFIAYIDWGDGSPISIGSVTAGGARHLRGEGQPHVCRRGFVHGHRERERRRRRRGPHNPDGPRCRRGLDGRRRSADLRDRATAA